MFKMKFEFDNDKLIKNNPEISMDIAMQMLDKVCTDTRFDKIGDCEYELQKDCNVVGTLLILTSRFDKQTWLYPNLKSWTTYDGECEQDALKIMTER